MAKEQTEWHRIVAFGKIAELIAQYVSKGSRLYVQGKQKTRTWEDKNGVTRYTTEVVIDMGGEIIFLDQKNASGPAESAQTAPSPDADDNGFSDDIPF